MAVRILFFAQAATWSGCKELERNIKGPLLLSELLSWKELAGLKERLRGVRFAVNRCFADGGTLVKDGDEVAVLPPVSGG